MRRNKVNLANCEIICWGDSAFANAEGEKSQHGVCFGLVPKGESVAMSQNGVLTNLIPLMGMSGTVKRRVRSTLAAEAYAISEGVEWAQLLRFVMIELATPPKQGVSTLRTVERTRNIYPIYCFTDSDNLTKSCRQDSGGVKDKRLRIVISMLREVLEIEPWVKIVWGPTNRMIADAFTKLDSPLVNLLEGFMQASKVVFPKGVKTRDSEVCVINNTQHLHTHAFFKIRSGSPP